MFNVGDAVVFVGWADEVQLGTYHQDHQQLIGQTGVVSDINDSMFITVTFPGFSYLDEHGVARNDFDVFADEIEKVVDPA